METVLMKAAFEALLNSSSDMVFLKDTNLIYRAASLPFVKMTGKLHREEIIGHTDAEIFEDQELAKRYQADDRMLMSEGKDLLDYMEPITDDNGQARYGSTSKYLLKNDAGNVIGILGITKDITREYLARQRYQQEFKYLFELPQDTYAVSYLDVDSWRIIKQKRQQINSGTLQQCRTVEELCQYAVDSMVDPECDAAVFYREFSAEKLWAIYSSGRNHLTFAYERKMSDGSVRWVQNEVHFLTEAESGHLCIMLSAKDVNDIYVAEQKILEAATLDQMTKVLNRETAMEQISRTLNQEGDKLHALFMLDVDNFKGLNDTLGHQAGDEFLINLAKELKNAMSDRGIVGRIGGDEFFLFLRNISSPEEAERKGQELLKVISLAAKPYTEVKVSGSIGIGLYPDNGRTLDALYSKADQALYEAKGSGKNRFVFAK